METMQETIDEFMETFVRNDAAIPEGTRPQMAAYPSSLGDKIGDHHKAHDNKNYQDSEPLSTRVANRRIQHLEAQLKGIAQVGEWRLEQLKLMDAEKRAADKTLEEERRFFADQCESNARENTARLQALQEHWFSLMNKRQDDDKGIVLSTLRLPTDPVSVSKLARSLDGMREQLKLRSDERDKWKDKCKKLEAEAFIAQQQLKQITTESEKWKAESVRLAAVESEGKTMEEVCKELLEQLEQRNLELKRCKEDLHKASKWQAGAQREIDQRCEEIQKLKRIVDDHNLKKSEVTECIICLDEFGADPDHQRAHWKDCNHANVCFKCTNTLWSSKKRKCPSCNTPASTMPNRLPPNIYL